MRVMCCWCWGDWGGGVSVGGCGTASAKAHLLQHPEQLVEPLHERVEEADDVLRPERVLEADDERDPLELLLEGPLVVERVVDGVVVHDLREAG